MKLLPPVGNAPKTCFDAETLGLESAPVSALEGGDKNQNLKLLQELFDGEVNPIRTAVLQNTAAALLLAGIAGDAGEGVDLAKTALDSGAAKRCLQILVHTSQREGQA